MNTEQLFDSIVLIEDDPSHALLIKRALRDLCSNVTHFEDVGSAISALDQAEPDLVITDLNLPDTTGVAHINRILEVNEFTPIIVLTSSTSLKDAVEAMQLGARDFVVKNFDGEFKEVLSLALSRVQRLLESEREKIKLQQEMEVLRRAIARSSDAFAIVDAEGVTQFCNPAFSNFVVVCGGADDRLDRFFSEKVLKYQELTESVKSNIERLNPGAVWHSEVTFGKGSEKAFDLSLSVIGSEDSVQKHYVIWVRDISELKRREKFQREILSTTTHDLKGPLGAISLSAELLQGMLPAGERPHDIVLRVGSSAQGAINLIDEFLSARRIQEGTFILKPEEQDLKAAIAELSENYETIAKARSIDFIVKADQEVPACVDKLGFVRAIGNLLSNALKFTHKGGKVTLTIERSDSALTVWVVDNGSGMEASEVQTIFERFSRLDKHDQVAGTGLGLFVVKSIVTAHGGTIEVTSQPGEGTTFKLVFPDQPPTNERGQVIALDFA